MNASASQWFWFIPSNKLWRATFKRQKPLTLEEVQQVIATNGPDAPLPGVFQQQKVQSVGSGGSWSLLEQSLLSVTVGSTFGGQAAVTSITIDQR